MTTFKKGFAIAKGSEIAENLSNYRNNYNKKGKYVGFSRFRDHYRMALGTCTDWTGFPRSGKTQVLMELLLNTSEYYGWRHLVYFPDVGNKIEIFADLIHKKTGKSFDPTKKNAITDEEIQMEMPWIQHHFLVLTKTDVKAKLTPFDFWEMAVQIKNSDPEGLQTASIDSWKDLNHNYKEHGMYATYLEVVLPFRNQLAEENNLHFHTIIHPKLTEKINGKRVAPTPYDLKGGSEWFNSGKSMITVHRESMDSNLVDIIFHKIKPRSSGSTGFTSLNFDTSKLRYYEQENCGTKTYAKPEKKENPNISAIQKNMNFESEKNQN